MTTTPDRPARIRPALAIGLGIALALGLAACSDDQPTATPPVTDTPIPVRDEPPGGVRTTGRGPEPPTQGVWMGAWAQAQWQTPSGRANELSEFADQTGVDLVIGHMFHDWGDEFPGLVQQAYAELGLLQLISWSGTDTRSITSGVYDEVIRQRAEAIRAYGQPVLLRWRWEMDRPNLRTTVRSPEDYVAAWKHLRRIFTEVGATNAAWVWCPHVVGFTDPSRNAAAYYPGDDQVDWLCTDVYPGPKFEGFAEQMDKFMAFASEHPRPVMLGEFGVTTKGSPEQRAAWLREAHRYIKAHPQIKAAIYFAAKQRKKPAYDSTFDNDPAGLEAFRAMAADPYFSPPRPKIHRSSESELKPSEPVLSIDPTG